MLWWTWIIIGFGLLVMELFAPSGFILLLVGASGIVTGILVLLGMGGPAWVQWCVCALLAVLFLFAIRRPLLGRQATAKRERVVGEGEEVVIQDDIAPGGVGRGDLRGSSWTIRNSGQAVLKKGERYRVERADGLTLYVNS